MFNIQRRLLQIRGMKGSTYDNAMMHSPQSPFYRLFDYIHDFTKGDLPVHIIHKLMKSIFPRLGIFQGPAVIIGGDIPRFVPVVTWCQWNFTLHNCAAIVGGRLVGTA